MSWKNWPSWLKGGMVVAGIGIIIDILLILLGRSFLLGGESIILILIIFGFPWGFILGYIFMIFISPVGDITDVLTVALGGLIGIIINGFIIGAIIGKIKSRRKRK